MRRLCWRGLRCLGGGPFEPHGRIMKHRAATRRRTIGAHQGIDADALGKAPVRPNRLDDQDVSLNTVK